MSLEYLVKVLSTQTVADDAVRVSGEAELATCYDKPGFFPAMLTITSTESLPNGVRLAAATTVHREICKYYSPDHGRPEMAPEDRQFCHANIVPFACRCANERVYDLLKTAVRNMVMCGDDVNVWPELQPQLAALLDPSQLLVWARAVGIIREVIYVVNVGDKHESARHAMVRAFYPPILHTFADLARKNSADPVCVYAQRQALKMYYNTLNLRGTDLDTNNQFDAWIPVLIDVYRAPLVDPVHNDPGATAEEKAECGEMKNRKWVVRILSIVNHAIIEKTRKKHLQKIKNPAVVARLSRLRDQWFGSSALQVIETTMHVLEFYHRTGYYNDKAMTKVFGLLSTWCETAQLYKAVKPHLPYIFSQVLPLALRYSETDIRRMDDDAIAMANESMAAAFEEITTRSSAGQFVEYLCKVRAVDILEPMMNMIVSSFEQYQTSRQTLADAMGKEAMMFALQQLARNLMAKSGTSGEINGILAKHIVPEFGSKYTCLRTQASEVVRSFRMPLEAMGAEADAFMSLELRRRIVDGLTANVQGEPLYSKVSAAFTISTLCLLECFKELVRPTVTVLLSQMIALCRSYRQEMLITSLDLLLDQFSDDIAPHADELLQISVTLFASYVQAGDEEDDAIFVASNTLDMVHTLVKIACEYSFDQEEKGQPTDLYLRVCRIVFPFACEVISEDTFNLADVALSFLLTLVEHYELAKGETASFWDIFPVIIVNLGSTSLDFADNVQMAVNSYLKMKDDAIFTREYRGQSYLQLVMDYVRDVVNDVGVEVESCPDGSLVPQRSEKGYAMLILVSVLHYCYEKCPAVLEGSFSIILPLWSKLSAILDQAKPTTPAGTELAAEDKESLVNLLERVMMVVSSMVIVNPEHTLTLLVQGGLETSYITTVIAYSTESTSILSKRLALFSLLNLLRQPPASLQRVVGGSAGLLLQACVDLMRLLVDFRAREGGGEGRMDTDKLLDLLAHGKYKRDDWGYGEDEDVDDEEPEEVTHERIKALYMDDIEDAEKGLETDVTLRNDLAEFQQALRHVQSSAPSEFQGLRGQLTGEAQRTLDTLMVTNPDEYAQLCADAE